MPDNPPEPLVSVIIPTYNRAHLIADAVQSVLDQTYPNIEVIVVDDGSTDETVKVLDRFGDAVTVLKQVNQGVAAARNTGIKAVQGDYISFLDSDDMFVPEKIARQMETPPGKDALHFCRLANVDLIEGSGIAKRMIGDNINWITTDAQGNALDQINDLAKGRYINVVGLLARREVVERIGDFDPRFSAGEDEDWIFRGALFCTIKLSPDAYVLRRMHDEQTGLHRESSVQSLIGVFGNMIRRARENGHPDAARAVHVRLANNLSKLSTIRANQRKPLIAARTAFRAFLADPRQFQRAVKALWLLFGGKPAPASR